MPWKAVRVGGFYGALLLAWYLATALGDWPSFPTPASTWHALAEQARSGALWDGLKSTMGRMLIGYAISIVAGVALGIAMGTARYVDETVGGIVLGLQSLPSVTWLPLAVLWFGLSEGSIIFVVLMGSVCSIAISARTGVREIPTLLVRASAMLGGAWWKRIVYVILPAMLPSMVQGLKLGWSFAWRALLAAELLVASPSLGHTLNLGRQRDDVSLIFAMMFVIVLVGLVVDRLVFGRVERWVQERWGLAA